MTGSRGALFSKDEAEKQAFVEAFVDRAAGGTVVCVYPKNRSQCHVRVPGAYHVAYEDLTKREPWLRINNLIGPDSALILENPSRYPKISSEKFRYLYRLAFKVAHRAIVDIVPFTLDIQYLYTPMCYLGRDILGYAHYYAFRENYHEIGADGRVHSAHDFDVLAAKLAPVSRIGYDGFLCRNRRLVECPATAAEHAEYALRREKLFAGEKSPQRIVTRLADTVHAFDSRLQALLALLSELHGETVIYTNLATYAARVRQATDAAGFRNVVAVSYQAGCDRPHENAIYFESPIVKSYYLLDAESRLAPDARVFHFRGDTKVDGYLYGEIDRELRQLDGFTKELKKHVS